MGLLEKYGRKKTGEKRNKQIGAKIEKSLYDDFSAHCDGLGLTISDGIRYLIIEELNRDKTEVKQVDNQGNTNVVPLDIQGETTWLQEAQITRNELGKYIEALNDMKETDAKIKAIIGDDETTKDTPTYNKGNTKVKPKKTKGTTKVNPLDQWTINKKLPCPECEKWMLRKSFHKHCRNKHNANAPDWMLLHKNKADAMVQEKQAEPKNEQ